jgi:hydroxysqualene dehydroxylase
MAYIKEHGGQVMTGHRVQKIERHGSQWLVDAGLFDAVVIACPPWDAARLLANHAPLQWLQDVNALHYEAITTVYAHADNARLAKPMLALRSDARHPAQFVFDRAQLGGKKGLLAFVISASTGDRDTLQAQVIAQAKSQLQLNITVVQTIVEKRATFACTPALRRPLQHIAPGLCVCGDYVDGPYPATLEGAVRAGLEAARLVTL